MESHFLPVERSIREASDSGKMDVSISNVLRKKYQSNWRQICTKVLDEKFSKSIMMRVQAVLAINDNENEDTNKQIVEFIRKFGEISLQMMISETPLLVDLRAIGQKVPFNQSRHDSLDGFIKAGEECLVILPPIVKVSAS